MATAIMANETEIANAMDVLGLGNFSNDVLDEIELNRRLEISLEQADKGELRPANMVINELLAKIRSGHYDKK